MRLLSFRRIALLGLALSLAGLVLGWRWAMVDRYGTDLPNWDQWDAEGLLMIAPWFGHSFDLATPFIPQNEHRVVLTKILNLALTLANGQWDQRLEMVVNALLPAAIALAWLVLAARTIARCWLPAFWLVLAATYAAPLSWQNVVSGFHSQQFFLIGLSFAAIAGLVVAAPGTRRWWLGAACAVLALGSMASGFFAAIAAALIVVLRRLRREQHVPIAATLALTVALTILGWWSVAPQPGHEYLKAHSLGQFRDSLLLQFEWPLSLQGHPAPGIWAAALLWLPWLWLALRTVFGPSSAPRRNLDWLLMALGGWIWMQVAATAYARGGGEAISSRYLDTFAFGLPVNALAALRLLAGTARVRRLAAMAAGLAWLAAAAAGIRLQLTENFEHQFPAVRDFYAASARSVRNYLATQDENYLQPGAIPYPRVDVLLDRLNLEEIPPLLPMSVRPPLALQAAAGGAGFAEPGLPQALPALEHRRTWGSFVHGAPVAGAHWSSQPLTAKPGWLAIQVAGDAGRDGVSLQLRDAVDGAILAEVQPSHVPGGRWRLAYVPAPSNPFILEASVAGKDRWLAFGPPVEMATLSHAAWAIAHQGWIVAVVAAICGALFLAGCAALEFGQRPA